MLGFNVYYDNSYHSWEKWQKYFSQEKLVVVR